MYNTADSLEALDITEELLSFNTVFGIEEHPFILDDEYNDADFLINVRDFSELEKIKGFLLPIGYKAYIDDGKAVVKIEN
jgi:hypothetical protein